MDDQNGATAEQKQGKTPTPQATSVISEAAREAADAQVQAGPTEDRPSPVPDINSEVYIPAIYRLHLSISNVPELTRITAQTQPDAIIGRMIGVVKGGGGPMTTVEVIGQDTAADAGKFRHLCTELAKRFKMPVTMITIGTDEIIVEVIKPPAVKS